MPSRRSWTKQQLEWYQTSEFDNCQWWRQKDRADDIEGHLSKRRDGKKGMQIPPLLWEIFRRHPDVGIVIAALSKSFAKPRAIIKTWIAAFLGDGSESWSTLRVLLRYHKKSWPKIPSVAKRQFSRGAHKLVSHHRISREAVFPNLEPICDLLQAIRLNQLDERALPRTQREQRRDAVQICQRLGLGSLNCTTLAQLKHAISLAGQDLMVLSIDRNSSEEQVLLQFESMLRAARTNQLVAQYAQFHGSHTAETKTYDSPCPSKEILELFRAANPKVDFSILTQTDEAWSIRKTHQVNTSAQKPQGRLNLNYYTLLEQLDEKVASKYVEIRRLMAKFSLFVQR